MNDTTAVVSGMAVAGLLATVAIVLFVIVVAVHVRARWRQARLRVMPEPTETDLLAQLAGVLGAQTRHDAHEARVALIRAAHEAMIEQSPVARHRR